MGEADGVDASIQRSLKNESYLPDMDEFRARRVADALRDRGINAHLLRAAGEFGVRVSLPGGREAEWDTDGTAGLEAQVMRDGMLVGYVPQIEGSEAFDEAQIVDAIARTDYDRPVARLRAVAPPRGPALTPEGGVFRRFLDGFRYRLAMPVTGSEPAGWETSPSLLSASGGRLRANPVRLSSSWPRVRGPMMTAVTPG